MNADGLLTSLDRFKSISTAYPSRADARGPAACGRTIIPYFVTFGTFLVGSSLHVNFLGQRTIILSPWCSSKDTLRRLVPAKSYTRRFESSKVVCSLLISPGLCSSAEGPCVLCRVKLPAKTLVRFSEANVDCLSAHTVGLGRNKIRPSFLQLRINRCTRSNDEEGTRHRNPSS